MNYKLVALSMASAALASPLASAATSENQVTQLDKLVISATRQEATLSEVPRSVTVIDHEALNSQFQVSRTLGDVLGKLIPGMAPASQTLTNFNQTLRGRKVLVLIDGIPQNANRNISRDLVSIDPVNIERIEVVRGGSAIYGSGAAGGIVNIVTRRPEAGATTTVGIGSSLTQFDSEALNYGISHSFGGQNDNVDYHFNLAFDRQNGYFDADGDRIAPEPSQADFSDTDSYSLAGKLRWHGDEQSLTLSFNHLDVDQDTDYVLDATSHPNKAITRSGLQLDDQARTRNSFVNLVWDAESTALGYIDAQVYYRDNYARFVPFDGRPYGGWQHIAQSTLDAEYWGSRLTINTELNETALVRWGLDYSHALEDGPVLTYDGTAYDNSNGLNLVHAATKPFVPEIEQNSLGAFAQLEMDLNDNLRWELGTRYEYVEASFDDFVTLGQNNAIKGGEVSYSDALFNTGLVYSLNSDIELFSSFSQGFELPDLGLRLRYAPATFDIHSSQLDPIKTDNYEIGMRGNWGTTQGSIALFYNDSKLGQTTVNNFTLAMPRQKERVYGLELTVDHELSRALKLGGVLTYMEGEQQNRRSGEWTALNGYRIPPLQLHAYAEYTPEASWLHRLQLNYSGSRDDALKDGIGYGGNAVDSYTTLDYFTRYQHGSGTFTLGIENLLNNDYNNVFTQLQRSEGNRIASSGATFKASYSYQW